MESKEEDEEGLQRSLSGSPGPAVAALAIEGEEALAVCRPQLVHGYILTYFFEQTNYRWQRS